MAKRYVFRTLIALFVFIAIPLFALKINKIKVIGNTHTKTKTILNFATELQTGKEFSEKKLNKLAQRVKERLYKSFWFYKVNVYITPTSKGDDYRNIIIDVEDGFLYRFGGGNAYGMFGMDNVWGDSEFFRACLGYNNHSINLGKEFLGKRLSFEATLGNIPYFASFESNASYYSDKYQNLTAIAGLGYRINYDFRVMFSANYKYILRNDYSPVDNTTGNMFYPSLKLTYDGRSDGFSSAGGFYLSAEYDLFVAPLTIHRAKFIAKKYFPIVDSLNLAMMFAAKMQSGDNNPNYLLFSLVGAEGVRGGYSSNLIGNASLEGHIELRWKFLEFAWGGIFNNRLEALVFYDIGKAYPRVDAMDLSDFGMAYGLGLRIFFDMPVFVPLRFAFGWNKQGVFGFNFSMESPF